MSHWLIYLFILFVFFHSELFHKKNTFKHIFLFQLLRGTPWWYRALLENVGGFVSHWWTLCDFSWGPLRYPEVASTISCSKVTEAFYVYISYSSVTPKETHRQSYVNPGMSGNRSSLPWKQWIKTFTHVCIKDALIRLCKLIASRNRS